MLRALLLLLPLALLSASAPQPPTRFVVSDGSTLWITGTSSLHDWRCDAGQLVGWIDIGGTAAAPEVTDAEMRVPTRSLECKNGTMNGKAHRALAADAHATIRFALTSAATSLDGSAVAVRVTGRLAIAGQSRAVTTTMRGTWQAGKLALAGSFPIVMSDFGIDPPSAMLGTLKTGDRVTVHVNLTARPAGTL